MFEHKRQMLLEHGILKISGSKIVEVEVYFGCHSHMKPRKVVPSTLEWFVNCKTYFQVSARRFVSKGIRYSFVSLSKLPYGHARLRSHLTGTLVTLTFCASVVPADPALERKGAPWPDTLLARVEAHALIETLNAQLLCASCTVTEILDKWCADHKLASDPAVHARLIPGTEKPVSAEQRQRLQIGPEEEVAYRHVELSCGGHVLVEAANWYVPSRVGADINRVLTTTDTPFGRAVRSLNPVRKNLSVEYLWKPLPDGWKLGPPPADRPGEALAMPWRLFQHRAVIYNDNHVPFSEVSEIFTREVLAFGPP